MRTCTQFAPMFLMACLVFPGLALGDDQKAISPPTACVAYPPDTTAAELQISTNGIYNPGTTTEKVFCGLPRDSGYAYQPGNAITVTVFYRVVSATAAKLTCTLYIGSTSQTADPVTTVTATGPSASAGGRTSVVMTTQSQPSDYNYAPNSLVCAIPPKTSLGSITLNEETGTEI
jgi:hypothetical protein